MTIGDYFVARGRIARATWLARVLVAAAIAIAFGLLASAVAGDAGAAVVAFAFTWCFVAVSAKRLHDTGKSAWALAVAVIPIVGPLWVLFQLTRAGVEGRNRYGADPDRLDYLEVDIAQAGP